jgi:hypothetical protein
VAGAEAGLSSAAAKQCGVPLPPAPYPACPVPAPTQTYELEETIANFGPESQPVMEQRMCVNSSGAVHCCMVVPQHQSISLARHVAQRAGFSSLRTSGSWCLRPRLWARRASQLSCCSECWHTCRGTHDPALVAAGVKVVCANDAHRYVDQGGNPHQYTAEVFQACTRDNQVRMLQRPATTATCKAVGGAAVICQLINLICDLWRR